MKTGCWYRISGDHPDLGLEPTAPGTRFLADGDPATDLSLNPSRTLEMHVRRLMGRYVKAPWSGSCDFMAITETWNGAAFADFFGSSGSMIVFGGGHNDYFGSDVHAFDLATRQWQRISDGYVTGKPHEYGAGAVYEQAIYPDGSPLPPHTYGYVQYDPEGNDFLLFKGQRQLGPNVEPIAIPHLFNLDTLSWRQGPRHPDAELKSGGWTAWDLKRRILWGNSGDDGKAFLGFSPDGGNADGLFTMTARGRWTERYAGKLPGAADHNAMVYDPARDQLVIVVHVRNALFGLDPANPADPARLLNTAPTVPLHPYAAIEYASNLDCLIYYSADNGADIYAIHPPREGSQSPAQATRLWTKLLSNANTLDPVQDAAESTRHPTNRSHTFGRFRVACYGDMDIGILIRHIDTPVYAIKLSS